MSESNRVETDTVKKSLDEIKDLSEIKVTSKELLSSTTLKLPTANSVLDQQDKTTNPILAKNNGVSQEPVKSAALPSVVDADKKQLNATAAAALVAVELKTKEELVTKQKKELEEKVKAAEAAALKVKDKLEAEQRKEKDGEKMSTPADVKMTAASAGAGAAGTAAAAALKASEEFDVKQKEQEDKLNAAIAAATARRDKKEMELKEKQLMESKEKEKEKEKEAEKTLETSSTASKLAADRFTAKVAVEVEKIKIGADMPEAATLNTKEVETVAKVDVDVDAEEAGEGEGEGEGEETVDNDKEYVEIQYSTAKETKEAPATGTWNSWLGSTGLKAAGLGMGLASVVGDVTRTSIAKVQKVRSEGTHYPKAYESFSKELTSVQIIVNAGSATSIPFFVPKGKAMIWKVMMKSFDISFALKQRVQADGGAVERDMDPAKKVCVGELYVGEAKETEEEDRRLVIYLDNTQSKLRAKTLIYQALVGTPEKIQEMKELYLKQEEEYNALSEIPVTAVATDTSTKSETQNQIPLQVLSNKNETENDSEKVLESDGSKVQDPSPPVANSYMNNLFSISSSVMKRAQGTSAAQYLQSSGGVMGSLWGKKVEPADENVDKEKKNFEGDRNGALYDIDSECEEGGDDDEKSSKSPKVSADSNDGTEGVVVPPVIRYY